MIHWIVGDDTCILKLFEKTIRKQYNSSDCVSCDIIDPIYNFTKTYDKYKYVIYFITIFLWLYSLTTLYCKYSTGDITHWQQLFIV